MWTNWLLSALSGVMMTLGFPKPELYVLTWVALVPLLWAIRQKSAKEAFGLGYACGMVHYATTLYWIHFVVNYYGGIPSLTAVLILLLFCAYLALFPACFALLARRWEPYPLLWILGLPGVWVALEWLRGHLLTGFPWANLGYTQSPFFPLIQIADVTGVLGVSWLIVLANTTLVACWHRVRAWTSLAVFILCMGLALSYGFWRIKSIDRLQEQASLWNVGIVQGNIDQNKKWDPAFQQETLNRYYQLSRQAVDHNPRPDLLVWPETSVPFFYGIEEKLTSQLNGMIQQIGTPLLFGSPAVSWIEGQARLLNRAYLVNEQSRVLAAYAKQHLVPFGEYVPLKKVLFFVHRMVQAAGDFAAGDDPSPLVMDGRPFGVLICYEGIFPELARATVSRGATALIILTNDAWYGTTSAPYQHLEIARWRAVEARVPLIRAANTGISATFDALGRMSETIPLNQQGYQVHSVRPLPMMTVYTRWGDWLAWVCMLLSLIGMGYATTQGRSAHHLKEDKP